MIQIIAIIILVGSVLGILLILIRKIPVLIGLPRTIENPQKKNLFSVFKNKCLALKNRAGKFFLETLFLQKLLSRCRILILKIEKRIDTSLQKLRKKTQNKTGQPKPEEQKPTIDQQEPPPSLPE
ncbi:MAG: hypothetical protein COU98_00580 [Candidatus Staskawiczbacteria bacterium CG10_big_fil_rev_8_21_14_0_10_38_10]|uniref:Uncharacterized protein n=1 Tax=Candidatus Staskawiczbacteria bacterium CG10_big_fil_rev_8_21_14_0_10_38_10 TaxID=1974891 RepID=A0A2H9T1S9_9BACT|nr:MAG: hypothetical protein COU98_00580 [Candidatus Staskawiczbacteria bacterium CG10_big_fil_rev_8_21_14_0_10_38_10]